MGSVMFGLPADEPLRRVLGRVHSLTGVVLGLLTLVRLRGPGPAPIPLAPLHRNGAAFIQALIYVGLFGMAATGVATAYKSNWHAYIEGADPSPVFEGLLSRQAHGALVIGLVLLVSAHVVGVLVHQVRKGGALRRILPFGANKAPRPSTPLRTARAGSTGAPHHQH